MSEDTRVYELGFILVPTTTEADVPNEVGNLKSAIEKVAGKTLTEGNPEFIDLAYQMEKNIGGKKLKWTQGYFGWIKFESDPEAMEALKKVLDGNMALIRYILIKTSAENSIVFKKPKVEPKRISEEEEIVVSEEDLAALDAPDDLAPDHEKLPDLAEDIAEDVEESIA